jgi:FkbM family methyltransferase
MRQVSRRIALRAFSAAAQRLGPGFSQDLIRRLARNTEGTRLVGDLAREAGFVGLMVAGENGLMSGSLDDDAALFKYARERRWATHQQQLFTDLFRPAGGTYVDVGANIGLTVISIARLAGVSCHAFEPAPDNVTHLRRNLALNDIHHNVCVHQVALFEREAELVFELATRHSGDHRIRVGHAAGQLGESERRTIRVPARRLDDVITDIRRPLGIKIDTQGAESFVVRGGPRTLAAAELVALEFWPYSMARMGGDVGALLDFFRDHYREGSATPGDADQPPSWQTMASLVGHLKRYAAESAGSADRYLDVLLRK